MFSISALFRVLLSLGSSLLQELIHIFFCDDGVRDFVVLRHILAGHQRLTGIYDIDIGAVQIGHHRGNAGAVGLDIIEDVYLAVNAYALYLRIEIVPMASRS